MSGRNGKWSVRGGPVTGPPPILPIRKSDDLRMSKSLFDGHSLPVCTVITPPPPSGLGPEIYILGRLDLGGLFS